LISDKIIIKNTIKFMASPVPKFWSGTFLFFALILTIPLCGFTASLYLSPSTGTYNIGDTFSVILNVDTEGKSINAAEGNLSFPKDKLRVLNISRGSSIFNLWTQEPSFSNSDGTITFGGGLPHPGYIGSSGSILTARFWYFLPEARPLLLLQGLFWLMMAWEPIFFLLWMEVIMPCKPRALFPALHPPQLLYQSHPQLRSYHQTHIPINPNGTLIAPLFLLGR